MPTEYQAQFTGPEKDYDFALGSIYALRTFTLYRGTTVPNSVLDDRPLREYLALKGHWQQPWIDGENTAICLKSSAAIQLDVACKQLARRFGLEDLSTTELKRFIGFNSSSDLTAWKQKFPQYAHVVPLQRRTTEYGFDVYEYLDPCGGQIPFADCTCGFYGAYELQPYFEFIHDYAAVVQHYGKTLIGTKGVRSTKARIIALAFKASIYDAYLHGRLELASLKQTYPSVEFFEQPDGVGRMIEKYPATRP